MTPKGIAERDFARTLVVSLSCCLLLSCGCVNLPNQTKKTRADIMKSPDAMKKFSQLKGDKLVTKVKNALPGLNRPRQTIKPLVAKDDPTRLDNMPESIGPSVYLSSARMAEQSGRPDVAREQYRKILKEDRTNRNAIIGLARLYYRAGDMTNAERLYREGLSMYRNDAVIMNDLGLCYARKGQLNESISMLQAALQASPGRKMYINNLAAALVEANRNNEAVAYLTQAHGPDQANLQVGYMLREAGRQDLAMGFLDKALAINPNLQAARDLIEQQATRVSSLPTRDGRYSVPGSSQKKRPVVTPVNPLSDSKSYRPQGQFESITPAELAEDIVASSAERVGPYGFVPPPEVSDVQVVSYIEDVE